MRRTTPGAGIAVLLFASALLSACGGNPERSDTTRTSEDPIAVPADFPLTLGMRAGGISEDRIGPSPTARGLTGLTLCGVDLGAIRGDDRLAANGIGPRYSDDRVVLSMPSVADAADVLDTLRAAIPACPADDNGQWTTIDQEAGDEAVTIGLDYTEGQASDLVQMTRVGRGVLVLHDFQADGTEEIAKRAAELTVTTAELTPAMCVFTAAGCAQDPTPHADGASSIPDDFPLDMVVPTNPGYTFRPPTHENLDGDDLGLCDRGGLLASPRDRMQAQPTHGSRETRTLLLYQDEATATTTLDKVRAALAACPAETFTDRSGSSSSVPNKPLALPLDDEYVAWTNGASGRIREPEIGLVLLRRGAAILVVRASRENRNPGAPVADRLTGTSRTLAKKMCIFTAAGC